MYWRRRAAGPQGRVAGVCGSTRPAAPRCPSAQATISQESAAEEPPAAALRGLGLPGLEDETEGSGAPPAQSVDEVLAEVDAALAAAEAAVAKGRTPSPPAWPSPSLRHSGSSLAAGRADQSPSPSASAGSVSQPARPAQGRATHLSSLR